MSRSDSSQPVQPSVRFTHVVAFADGYEALRRAAAHIEAAHNVAQARILVARRLSSIEVGQQALDPLTGPWVEVQFEGIPHEPAQSTTISTAVAVSSAPAVLRSLRPGPITSRDEVDMTPEIDGIHHIDMYVSNSYQAAHFYRTVLGFQTVASRGPSTGPADRTSVLLRRGDVRLILTAPLTATSEVAEHLRLHGEGIKDIAFSVSDPDGLFTRAVAAGVEPIDMPATVDLGSGSIRAARLKASGVLTHSLIARSHDANGANGGWRESEPLLPGFVPVDGRGPAPDTAVDAIDHIALAVPAGDLDRAVSFYIDAFGFHETHQENVSTEYSAMRSKVVTSPNGAVRFPIMEPAEGRRQSQIETYVKAHHGSGAQHLAFRSHDIVKSVSSMKGGLEFMATPATYYDSLEARVGVVAGDYEEWRRHGILVDRDANGLLLQVFTKPIGPRPTLFLEVIERRGAEGFGSGNIKALFEAVERTHAASGAA